MPTDATYIRFIDTLGANGPLWIFFVGLLLIIAGVAIKAMPTWRDVQMRRLEIEDKAEERRATELKMRNERDMELSANNARMTDAMHDTADSNRAIAAALSTLTVRLDASQLRSEKMNATVDDISDTTKRTFSMVDDLHEVVIKGKKVL